jgi:lipoprotein-anchoring transpeptidase ErfK/SrfK
MNFRSGALLGSLLAAVAIPAAPALAQYYPLPPSYQSPPPSSGYRGGTPQGYYRDDAAPGPGYFADDDDDAPSVRPLPPRYGQSGPYGQQYNRADAPSRILPYPAEEADATAPQPPGYAQPNGQSPAYGHQLDTAAPRGTQDPEALRPPGSIGAMQAVPKPVPPAATAALPPEDQPEDGQPKELPDNLKKQLVNYPTDQPAGTVIVDTPHTYLYLVLGGGKAIRYGIGVGREGFTWSGTERVSKMSEWPDWHPPPEMIDRQPYLPRFMAGGPGNPLGARALYLGKTLYRIHGTNQPSTIGQTVSSGCIRLINEDIEDLFSRVQVGSRVVVLPGRPPETVANTGNPPAVEPAANPMAPPARPGNAVSGSPLPPPTR